MSLIADVNLRITQAMKAHDALSLSTFRMLKAALMNKEVEKSRALEDAEEMQVVGSLIKQRRESVDQFLKGGRRDLADKEQAEIGCLEQLLPPAPTEDELQAAVDAAVTETGATSAKDMGRVMKAVMARLAGKPVDGKAINELVRKRLLAG